MVEIKNFILEELIHTDTDFYNLPSDLEIVRNLVKCAEYLQEIRDSLKHAIVVNSGYRSQQVNKAVGGVPTSNHLKGLAYDIKPIGCSLKNLHQVLIDYFNKYPERKSELIKYDTFIHVAFK